MAMDVKFHIAWLIVLLSILSAMQMKGLPLGYDPYLARDSRLNAYLKSVLDPLKEHMRKGFPKFGLPTLDPLVYGNVSKSISSKSFNMSLFVQDMTISGMSNFSLHRLDAYLRNLSVVIRIVFPKVIISSEHYQINGSAADIIPLKGDGQVDVHINDIDVTVAFRFSIPTPGKIHMEDASLDVDYGRASVDFEDLMGGGALGNFVNGYLSSDRAKKLFTRLKPDILKNISNLVKEKANKMLKGFDLTKFDF